MIRHSIHALTSGHWPDLAAAAVKGRPMGTLSCLLAATASIAALTTGCALKPVQVTGKENNGSQSETAFTINRVGDVARLTVAYNDGTDHPAIQYTATTRVTK